jgi:hypothetical protein
MSRRAWQRFAAALMLVAAADAADPVAGAPPAPEPSARPVPLFDDLGSYHRPITTSSPEAQRYFDQGLRLYDPENGWSLFGLAESLAAQGDDAAAAEARQRFAQSWKRADVTLSSSAF